MSAVPHVLTVALDVCGEDGCTVEAPCAECLEHPQVEYALACPGVEKGRCLMYWECIPCTSRARQDDEFSDRLYDEEPQHGKHHESIAGMWCTPSETGQCFAADGDFEGAAGNLTETPGTYRVFPEWDEGVLLEWDPDEPKKPCRIYESRGDDRLHTCAVLGKHDEHRHADSGPFRSPR